MPPGWRTMRRTDVAAMVALAAIVHPDLPEGEEILAERLELHEAGCFVHMTAEVLTGYLISHPWHAFAIPPLNRPLGALPAMPTTYYLHDLALHPAVQGSGAAGTILRHLFATVRTAMSLVAVNGSAAFWHHHGFREASRPGIAAAVAGYGADARFMTRL